MTSCIGILGKIFGHKFASMIVKKALRWQFENCQIGAEVNIYNIPADEYIVVCQRCGKSKEAE